MYCLHTIKTTMIQLRREWSLFTRFPLVMHLAVLQLMIHLFKRKKS